MQFVMEKFRDVDRGRCFFCEDSVDIARVYIFIDLCPDMDMFLYFVLAADAIGRWGAGATPNIGTIMI
jgi:hypothetical protein